MNEKYDCKRGKIERVIEIRKKKIAYSPGMEPGVNEVNEEETENDQWISIYVIIIWHELQLNLQLSR